MALAHEKLLLDRFVEYNKRRYSEEPAFVAVLEALIVEDNLFSNYRKVIVPETNLTRYLVDVIKEGSFKALDQIYTPGELLNDLITTKVETAPLTLEELKQKQQAGIYYLEEEGGVKPVLLVNEGEKTLADATTAILSSSNYDIPSDDITVNEDISKVFVDSVIILGELEIVESEIASDQAFYDGTYEYDGEVSY